MEVLGQDRREGLGRRAEPRVYLLTAIFVSILLLLSSLYSAEASVFKKARETVLDAAEPMLALLAGPIAFVQGMVGDVNDYFGAMEQNKALRDQIADLRQWESEAKALRRIIAQYEDLGKFKTPPAAQPVNGFVISDSNDVYTRTMVVNVGRGAGVARGQAVIDDGGLVGRIVETGARASRILLLTDVQSRVPVYIEDAGLEGILLGRSGGRPAISFTQSSEPTAFATGQRVLTSGAGGVVPRGLPVGEIVAERDGEATVNLYADYAQTRLVRVINYEFPKVDPAADPQPQEPLGPAPVGGLPAAPPAPAPAVEAGDEPRQPVAAVPPPAAALEERAPASIAAPEPPPAAATADILPAHQPASADPSLAPPSEEDAPLEPPDVPTEGD